MKKLFLLLICIICFVNLFAQKQTFDSLASKLATEKIDTNRARLMWLMAYASNMYNPDTSILLAQRALYLSQKRKFTEGISQSLGILASAIKEIGNYPKALEFNLQKLKIEEERNNPHNLAVVYINIGSLYVYLEQYKDAIEYYKKADSVINLFHLNELEYYTKNNMGDIYERMGINDSSFLYFDKALSIATKMNDKDLMGASMAGLGHVYLKQDSIKMALQYYIQALFYLETSNDDDLVCETSLGLAKLYEKVNTRDSAEHYALISLQVAKNDGFKLRQLEAATFLAMHYKQIDDFKNAFTFLETAQGLKDSISGDEKIRESQVISSNEELRQNEIVENKRIADEERNVQLQMLLIGLFIPILFLITLLLYKIRIHHHIIRFLGILSVLMLFEYLLLMLHPRVEEFTHHTPIFEILIFVVIASILIPTHHRIEHWLIKKLTSKRIVL